MSAYRLIKSSDAKEVILDVCKQVKFERDRFMNLKESLSGSPGCETLAFMLQKGKYPLLYVFIIVLQSISLHMKILYDYLISFKKSIPNHLFLHVA